MAIDAALLYAITHSSTVGDTNATYFGLLSEARTAKDSAVPRRLLLVGRVGSMSPTRLGPAEDLMLYPSKAPRKPLEAFPAPLLCELTPDRGRVVQSWVGAPGCRARPLVWP